MGLKTELQEKIIKKYMEVVIGCTCDVCGKSIKPTKPAEDPKTQVDLYNCYEITTGHHDWGNDSCESITHYYVCSPECACQFMEPYLERNFKQYNTHYFEIERLDRIDP